MVELGLTKAVWLLPSFAWLNPLMGKLSLTVKILPNLDFMIWDPGNYSSRLGFPTTPFENVQRSMGKNMFPILLLNDNNMIREHLETRIEMPNMCPFEKKEKEVFFRLPTFFFRNKKFFSKEQLLFSFLCIIMQKKISERSEYFWNFFFSKIA